MKDMRRFKAEIASRPDGKVAVSVSMPFIALGPDVGDTDEKMEASGLLFESATPARRKIAAARWFNNQLRRCIRNEVSTLMFLESLLVSMRSATFALQKMFAHSEGFKEWYQQKQESMKKDPVLRLFVELRNMAEKEGLILGEYGPHAIIRLHKDGQIEAIAAEPTLGIAGIDTPDILPILAPAIDTLESIIEEAHGLFPYGQDHAKHTFRIEYVREREDGRWEHFDPQ